MTTDIPRCATCKWWTRFERTEPGVWNPTGKSEFAVELPVYRGEDGACTKLPEAGRMIELDHLDCYSHGEFFTTTHETFGCVLHEPREGD